MSKAAKKPAAPVFVSPPPERSTKRDKQVFHLAEGVRVTVEWPEGQVPHYLASRESVTVSVTGAPMPHFSNRMIFDDTVTTAPQESPHHSLSPHMQSLFEQSRRGEDITLSKPKRKKRMQNELLEEAGLDGLINDLTEKAAGEDAGSDA